MKWLSSWSQRTLQVLVQPSFLIEGFGLDGSVPSSDVVRDILSRQVVAEVSHSLTVSYFIMTCSTFVAAIQLFSLMKFGPLHIQHFTSIVLTVTFWFDGTRWKYCTTVSLNPIPAGGESIWPPPRSFFYITQKVLVRGCWNFLNFPTYPKPSL